MIKYRWFCILLLALCVSVSACDEDSNAVDPRADMGTDTQTDADPYTDVNPQPDAETDTGSDTDTDSDAGPDPDTIAPTVSITSGLRSDALGVYTLEGIAMDDRGLATLSYTINDQPTVQIAPVTSPFSVELTLPHVATLVVTAADAGGNEGTASITVTRANELSADFNVSPDLSTFSPVVFDASGSADVQNRTLTYTWDFGDSTTGTGEQVGHLFSASGTYSVKLVVSTDDGASDEVTRDIVILDPTPASTTPLTGVVLDTAGLPVHDVLVSDRDGTVLSTTNEHGEFSVMAGVGVPLVYVFTRADYATQVLRTRIETGRSSPNTIIRMMPRDEFVFLMDAAVGGVVENSQGARIEFPADSLVDDETGAAVIGAVALTLTVVDHQTHQYLAFPGLFQAYQPDGSQGHLTSFGAMEVTLSQNGRKVQLAPGKSAVVEVPYAAQGGQAGTTLPFYSFNERTGYWSLEDDAPIQAATSGSGLVHRAQVSHFSWISSDIFTPTAAVSIPFEFTNNGVTVTEEFEVDVEFECQEPGVSVQRITAKSGADSMLNFSDCDTRMKARSASGRYFGEANINITAQLAPIIIDVMDALAFPILTPGVPVQGTLATNGRAYFSVQSAALSSFSVRVESLHRTLRGEAPVIPPSRIARASEPFLALGEATPYLIGDGLWIIAVDAKSGTGDIEVEFTEEPLSVAEIRDTNLCATDLFRT